METETGLSPSIHVSLAFHYPHTFTFVSLAGLYYPPGAPLVRALVSLFNAIAVVSCTDFYWNQSTRFFPRLTGFARMVAQRDYSLPPTLSSATTAPAH